MRIFGWKSAFVLAISLFLFLGGWAFFWEPRRLTVREDRCELTCWRGRPIRVAVVSDLHVGSPYVGVDKLDEVVRRITNLRPIRELV